MEERREIWQIAQEIKSDWKRVSPYAEPYLQAMFSLITINDSYGWDSGDTIVRYFLANAGSWRGETARRIKKELNDMLK